MGEKIVITMDQMKGFREAVRCCVKKDFPGARFSLHLVMVQDDETVGTNFYIPTGIVFHTENKSEFNRNPLEAISIIMDAIAANNPQFGIPPGHFQEGFQAYPRDVCAAAVGRRPQKARRQGYDSRVAGNLPSQAPRVDHLFYCSSCLQQCLPQTAQYRHCLAASYIATMFSVGMSSWKLCVGPMKKPPPRAISSNS